MEGKATMSSEVTAQHDDEQKSLNLYPSPPSHAMASYYNNRNINKQTEEEQQHQGIRLVRAEAEQASNPGKLKDVDVVDKEVARLRASPPSQIEAAQAQADVHAMQDYVAQLPDALVPELALLLAQRMKQQLRDSGKFSQEDENNAFAAAAATAAVVGAADVNISSRMRAESSSASEKRQHQQQKQGAAEAGQLFGRLRRLDDGPSAMVVAAERYIVTPHLNQQGRSIKHRIGAPENVPFLPPGVYRVDGEGNMELETSFRRSLVEPPQEQERVEEQKQKQKQEGPEDNLLDSVRRALVNQGRLRKMMSKVFKRQTPE